MRFSTSYITFALLLVSVAAVPVAYEDGAEGALISREHYSQLVEARGLFGKGKGKASDEFMDKDRKDGKPPKYKDVSKKGKQPPKYDPQGHEQLDFHSEWDPNAGSGRKDGSSGGGHGHGGGSSTRVRELFDDYLEARGLFGKGKGKASDEHTDKDRKDGKPPKYKDVSKKGKQPPKYDPQGHDQLDFHSEWDPNAGSGRKDGSSGGGHGHGGGSSTRVREFSDEYLESRGLFGKGKGKASDEHTDKDRKDGKPPKYKDISKKGKQPPKYDPQGHEQLDFHSEWDPNAGSGRKDGSSGGGHGHGHGGGSSTAVRELLEEYLEARDFYEFYDLLD